MFDVIVVGGGHAGTEAAAVAARRGASVALITFDAAKVGAMSCNPAIGGLGKGHLVREVDAFDGLIARAADAAAIHYRMLNRSKGSAVQGPRIQADRTLYASAIQQMLDRLPGLTIVEGEADSLILKDDGSIAGIRLGDGSAVRAPAVVLATGTFLGGRLFRGEDRETGGRVGERAASRLAEQLRSLDLPMARLKTGTPPRLDGRTIDWAVLSEQPSDSDFWAMSPMTTIRRNPQIFCAITRTNPGTHDAIRRGLDRSPLFSGDIGGQGPRYCPSIEDKIHRFGDRDGHQVFLEPEGLDTHLVYPNGISTSLPVDVQHEMVRSMKGLEHCAIITSGYAVEYDYIDPRSLDHRLALPQLPGLYCAGQINGTTGYEEAAGQGLIAGANAAAFALDIEPLLLDRATSYLGVMVDDLVVQGVTEPYRMLTARAEYRLRLRANNAHHRLSDIAERLGCLGQERQQWVNLYRRERARLDSVFDRKIAPNTLRVEGLSVPEDGIVRSVAEWLRFPAVPAEFLFSDENIASNPVLQERIEDARYAPYLERQAQEVSQMQANDAISLNGGLDYRTIPGLSAEMVERLSATRPATLGQASRIRGITPAALSAILLYVKRAG
ncbi:tRNA uridine 5-carboxymethylaminomethyl modification enzyme [Stakelama sediminis]|uniref:tRNA uridine 5-carboxymethylaminomethyl modification enzyme MnmG n=1 Tax=Stakelama sediminis TaxID=463200 RepID=A0A840Z289_9SPHN|nr:tRNA uridine-5-carboxymethylaminomethyl(34) synthesis enzyme MnmG [Stakelama sediminis]MBB5719826.1 tRNA uridine 5-carboxymethylaminomethyl modification enzyme [Stakelama sediminis]